MYRFTHINHSHSLAIMYTCPIIYMSLSYTEIRIYVMSYSCNHSIIEYISLLLFICYDSYCSLWNLLTGVVSRLTTSRVYLVSTTLHCNFSDTDPFIDRRPVPPTSVHFEGWKQFAALLLSRMQMQQ